MAVLPARRGRWSFASASFNPFPRPLQCKVLKFLLPRVCALSFTARGNPSFAPPLSKLWPQRSLFPSVFSTRFEGDAPVMIPPHTIGTGLSPLPVFFNFFDSPPSGETKTVGVPPKRGLPFFLWIPCATSPSTADPPALRPRSPFLS